MRRSRSMASSAGPSRTRAEGWKPGPVRRGAGGGRGSGARLLAAAWSAGALVDRAGLKGCAIGHARVSPAHGNFIVNEGSATARDIRQLIDRCRTVVRERFGVVLVEEIVCLGDF